MIYKGWIAKSSSVSIDSFEICLTLSIRVGLKDEKCVETAILFIPYNGRYQISIQGINIFVEHLAIVSGDLESRIASIKQI